MPQEIAQWPSQGEMLGFQVNQFGQRVGCREFFVETGGAKTWTLGLVLIDAS